MTSTNEIPINDEKIIFKCDKHSAIISEKLQSFYQEDEFFDTILTAGSNYAKLQAHKVVLCALSEYFLQFFRLNQTASKDNVVELKEIQASTLKLVIDFMYTGMIELSLATVEELLRTASFLKLKTLVDGCCELIVENINYSNSLYWFRLAKELSLESLKAKSLECTYIHFENISKEQEILILNENELKDLLFNDNPHGDFEEEVFLSMVKWINYDKLNREHLTFQLLSMVRFWVLTPKFIVENRHSVCKTVESYELICSWLQWHLSPESRTNDYANINFNPRIKPFKLAVVRSYYDDNKKINIETFESHKNAWSIEIENCLLNKKCSFANIVIDGKLIVVGGFKSFEWQKTVECLDLKTFKWTDFPPMIKARLERCQLVDLKGYLGVFGRHSYDFLCASNSISMEVYNFSTCTWREIQPLNQLSDQNKIVAQNGVMYILDFKNGYLQTYYAASNQWTSKTIKKAIVKDYGLAAVERFLYVFGGHRMDNGECVRNVQRYDLSNNFWWEMAPLPYIQAATLIKTKVFENKIIVSDSVNIAEYNIDTDKWNTLSPFSAWYGTFDILNFNDNT
ncbi:kelch-like protein 1 [Episyrphus balteatus]|uniref:kelch-like protein 1 n=1 Tax=Episyrphus balteatus TaxID=286459 RepID=UPI002484DC28|nr:kelch-like protein 1 [Episyrphus balteatus]